MNEKAERRPNLRRIDGSLPRVGEDVRSSLLKPTKWKLAHGETSGADINFKHACERILERDIMPRTWAFVERVAELGVRADVRRRVTPKAHLFSERYNALGYVTNLLEATLGDRDRMGSITVDFDKFVEVFGLKMRMPGERVSTGDRRMQSFKKWLEAELVLEVEGWEFEGGEWVQRRLNSDLITGRFINAVELMKREFTEGLPQSLVDNHLLNCPIVLVAEDMKNWFAWAYNTRERSGSWRARLFPYLIDVYKELIDLSLGSRGTRLSRLVRFAMARGTQLVETDIMAGELREKTGVAVVGDTIGDLMALVLYLDGE